ncbi:MAG: hypothetical protein C0511_00220 [Hyphomicrobium sp.]|nr:hypothetical protein [Hyphomicrobium sp.]PPC84288.1 MAG: hypothetical protein CTY40_00220 [Hyphomicrobium sp.]
MAVHKYRIGQLVAFAPSRQSMPASSREYKVLRLMPPENGQFQYRIKSIAETYERTALEKELSLRT